MEPLATDEDITTMAGMTPHISSMANEFSKPLMILKGTLNHALVSILINSGSMGNFVSQQAVTHFSFTLHDISPVPICFTNGTINECNKTMVAMCLKFPHHEENLNLQVISFPHQDVILGKPWLERWNPLINWCTHEVHFPSSPTSPVTPAKTPTPSKTPSLFPLLVNIVSLSE